MGLNRGKRQDRPDVPHFQKKPQVFTSAAVGLQGSRCWRSGEHDEEHRDLGLELVCCTRTGWGGGGGTDGQRERERERSTHTCRQTDQERQTGQKQKEKQRWREWGRERDRQRERMGQRERQTERETSPERRPCPASLRPCVALVSSPCCVLSPHVHVQSCSPRHFKQTAQA